MRSPTRASTSIHYASTTPRSTAVASLPTTSRGIAMLLTRSSSTLRRRTRTKGSQPPHIPLLWYRERPTGGGCKRAPTQAPQPPMDGARFHRELTPSHAQRRPRSRPIHPPLITPAVPTAHRQPSRGGRRLMQQAMRSALTISQRTAAVSRARVRMYGVPLQVIFPAIPARPITLTIIFRHRCTAAPYQSIRRTLRCVGGYMALSPRDHMPMMPTPRRNTRPIHTVHGHIASSPVRFPLRPLAP